MSDGWDDSGSKHDFVAEDGFGNAWDCKHGLHKKWCLLAVMRPGKVQCVCDEREGGINAVLKFHYKRGKADGAKR